MTTAIVADDDQPNLELLSELLEVNNIKIIDKVQNGKEAVLSFQKLKPDVVFLDIMMPEFDGLYALEEIRKIDPSSIVIMITADTSDETSDRLDKLQPTAIVHKPYEMNSVIHFLNLQLELKEISKD
ncbi:MAG: response regulator [Nitrosopumilus sp.]|nr:response regulator [Nitrosopumilus sp.]MBL7014764.1 response regulator [Nitrosopumilus sp.]MBL7017310.1 response regulator [Nitrosopumilus sp.]